MLVTHIEEARRGGHYELSTIRSAHIHIGLIYYTEKAALKCITTCIQYIYCTMYIPCYKEAVFVDDVNLRRNLMIL